METIKPVGSRSFRIQRLFLPTDYQHSNQQIRGRLECVAWDLHVVDSNLPWGKVLLEKGIFRTLLRAEIMYISIKLIFLDSTPVLVHGTIFRLCPLYVFVDIYITTQI